MPIEKIREDLYIKKGWDGYRVVHPNKKDLNKPFTWENTNWKNVLIGGHWSYPLKLLFVLVVIYFFAQMYQTDTEVCREFVKNFETRCIEYYNTLSLINNLTNSQTYPQLNISKLNFTYETPS